MEQAKRRRYTAQFRQQILEACAQPGASVTAVARAHGVNTGLIYKWRAAAADPAALQPPVAPRFIALSPPAAASALTPDLAPIEIDVQRGGATLQIRWPQSCAAACAAWLRTWLIA